MFCKEGFWTLQRPRKVIFLAVKVQTNMIENHVTPFAKTFGFLF